MKRPDHAIKRLELRGHDGTYVTVSDMSTDICTVLTYLGQIESELAGYRSRGDSGFKRARGAQ